MVKLNASVSTNPDDDVNAERWLEELRAAPGTLDIARLSAAIDYLRETGIRPAALQQGLALARFASELLLDTDAVIAGLCYRTVRDNLADSRLVEQQFGADVRKLVDGLIGMSSASILELDDPRLLTTQRRDQAANVRRMLVALIDDVRLAVLKLAERVLALRNAKETSEERRRRIATEAQLIFAPLANRLGMAQVKWALEDLSLRYLEPEAYKTIASRLHARREEREEAVGRLMSELKMMCSAADIECEVFGRAKHIYSIWRKMHSKGLEFDEVYDVQAVRLVVSDVASCYAALGLIHTRWRHIDREFDDYIANPKANGYRSLHTAVLLDDGQPLEVQIRSTQMHEEAELGVCAHWQYKRPADAIEGTDDGVADKLDWLRQVLDLQEDGADLDELGTSLQIALETQRIYVRTPKGHVIDLAVGATPVDFAYRIHTEIGHRCRGALVNGRPAELDTTLATGQTVEVLTGEVAEPPQAWLEPGNGFVRTARARAKIQSYWHQASATQSLQSSWSWLFELLPGLEPSAAELADLSVDSQARLDGLLPARSEFVSRIAAELLSIRDVPEQGEAQFQCRFDNRSGLVGKVIAALQQGQADVVESSARTQEELIDLQLTLRYTQRSEVVDALLAMRSVDGFQSAEPLLFSG